MLRLRFVLSLNINMFELLYIRPFKIKFNLFVQLYGEEKKTRIFSICLLNWNAFQSGFIFAFRLISKWQKNKKQKKHTHTHTPLDFIIKYKLVRSKQLSDFFDFHLPLRTAQHFIVSHFIN